MDTKIIKVHANFTLSPEERESLTLLYQPLFSYPAMSLYLTLYELVKVNSKIYVQDLMKMLQVEKDRMVEYRCELERFNLIRTFQGEEMELVLQKPLAPNDFMHHTTYARLFAIVMGNKKFINYSNRYRNEPLTNKHEISASFDLKRLAIWDESMENMFNEKKDEGEPKSYNVDAFLRQVSLRLFPQELRTQEVKQIISEMAVMYNLSVADLKSALFNATNSQTMDFNARKFRFDIEKAHGDLSVKDVKDPYDLDPISFLKNAQNHDYVVGADKNLIQSLIHNFDFKGPVINVLLDYVLKNNQNMLNKAYVEKIASVWKRDKVSTKEEALKQIEKPLTQSKRTHTTAKRHIPMPDYSVAPKSNDNVEELERKLKEQLKKG